MGDYYCDDDTTSTEAESYSRTNTYNTVSDDCSTTTSAEEESTTTSAEETTTSVGEESSTSTSIAETTTSDVGEPPTTTTIVISEPPVSTLPATGAESSVLPGSALALLVVGTIAVVSARLARR